MEAKVDRADILKVATFLGMGYYRVKESGEFLKAGPKARDLLGIPQDETDLSKYSIADLYIFPAERELRLKKLEETNGAPISGTLSLRVNGENILLFDQCWYDHCPGVGRCFSGVVQKIEERVMSPEMFDGFPLGLYLLDEEKKIANFNKKALEIFGYSKSDEKDLIGRNIADFYVNPEEREKFTEMLEKEDFAHDVLKFKNVKDEVIELECFTKHHNEFKKASWGVIHDVTKRQRYYRALDKMPTGYYDIVYDPAKPRHEGSIVNCNEEFAKILGVPIKEDLYGRDTKEFFAEAGAGERYYKRLDEEDAHGKPVLDYTFRIIRADTQKIAYISVDSHLVKENGKLMGREGTIRDITDKVKLERKVKKTKKRLERVVADINNLIHTFMHPVLKSFGHADLFHQVGQTLFVSLRCKKLENTDLGKLGRELEAKFDEVQKKLKNVSKTSEITAVLIPAFKKIANVFDYELKRAKRSNILLDKAIRDAALWILEELEHIDFFMKDINRGSLNEVITNEFIEYLQEILLGYLIRTALILKGNTQIMRRGVEALRRYITLEEKKIYNFRNHSLKKILEENIELFKPILAQKEIEIEYQLTGNLSVKISENDIDRVVCNLLHNASKYSHPGPGRHVEIKARELHREDSVEFTISSLGIPIKKHEIDNGDIFKFGYRSELVFKADRDGTGVGLADAKEVIEAHGGNITVSCEPIKDDGNPPHYKVPYITTVTVKLPRSGEIKEGQK